MGTACPAVPVVFDAAKLIDFQVRCKHKTDNVLLISDMAGIHLDKPSYTGVGERTERTAVAPLKQQKTPFTQNKYDRLQPQHNGQNDRYCFHTCKQESILRRIAGRLQTAGSHRTPSHVADSHTLIQV